MAKKLEGKRVAILAADMFERVELEKPRKALDDEGAITEVVSIHDGEIKAFDHFDPAGTTKVDKTVEEISVDDYDALLIPGGYSPDHLRADRRFVEFVRRFEDARKTIAAVCHGPQILMTAGLVKGRTLTAWQTIQDDLRLAGANVKDEPVVRDQNWITSRKPDDLKQFSDAIVDALEGGDEARSQQPSEPAAHP